MRAYGPGVFDDSIVVAEGKTIRIERDVIEVSMLHPVERDPDWRFVDDAGHEHVWVEQGLPTIEYVETGGWWCDECRERHLETEPRCRQCGQVIEPGYRDAPNPQYITGALHVFVDDVELPYEEGRALLERLGA